MQEQHQAAGSRQQQQQQQAHNHEEVRPLEVIWDRERVYNHGPGDVHGLCAATFLQNPRAGVGVRISLVK